MITLNGKKIEFGQFPNGEINVPKLKQAEENKVVLKYEDDRDLIRLQFVRQWLVGPVDLYIPYFPYSRMDRRSDAYEFTLYSVTDFINYLDFDSVTIYEPHSDVTPALLEKCNIKYLTPTLLTEWCYKNKILGKYQVFYPDAGAQKRYADLLSEEEEYALAGFKTRDFKTGRIKDLEIVGKVNADTVVIVDDLCSKGGTFILAAEKLRQVGFSKVDLVVAHCENTIFQGKIFDTDLIDGVYTTDSIIEVPDHECPKLNVFSITY